MTPAQELRVAIMQLTPLERLELGTWLWSRRMTDHEQASGALAFQLLADRVRELGVDEVAKQEGVKPPTIYARLNRAGVHLRGKQSSALYKTGHEPRHEQSAPRAAQTHDHQRA